MLPPNGLSQTIQPQLHVYEKKTEAQKRRSQSRKLQSKIVTQAPWVQVQCSFHSRLLSQY